MMMAAAPLARAVPCQLPPRAAPIRLQGQGRMQRQSARGFGELCTSSVDAAEPEAQGVLGGLDFIYSQKSGVEELLFKGSVLGVDADVASLDYRENNLRSLKHLEGDFYVPSRFKERIAVHFAKNFLAGSIPGNIPLILGLWGKKGCGKSFNVELCCVELGVTPVVVSAGELEDEVAGLPGARIRDRYLEAAELMHNQGRPACLIVNDIDAGLGRFKGAQMTVNNQNVQGTLMNICDNPNEVSVGKTWVEGTQVPRVPIVVTANDLSKIYAPLLRDGRMDKFYWEPFQDELAESLLELFPEQPLDFFGAVKSRTADWVVREWLQGVGYQSLGSALVGKGMGARLQLDLPKPSLAELTSAARELAAEQQAVMGSNLAREYFKRGWDEEVDVPEVSNSSRRAEEASRWQPQVAAGSELHQSREGLRRSLRTEGGLSMKEAMDKMDADSERAQAEEAQEEQRRREAERWPSVQPLRARELMDSEGYVFLDIRSQRDFDRDAFNKAISVPCIKVVGFGVDAEVEPLPGFAAAMEDKFPDKAAKLLVVGCGNGEHGSRAMDALLGHGFTSAVEVAGGYPEWSKFFRTNGKRRAFGNWASGAEHEMWTGSN